MQSHFDYLVLGGGPAAIQLGYYFQRDNRDYLILEGGESIGTFFRLYPRHRQLISINKVYTGSSDPEICMRHDWNSLLTDDHSFLFKQFSKEYFPPAQALLDYLQAFVEQHQIRVQCGTRIESVRRLAEGFALTDTQGKTYTCNRLIVASGVSKPYIPEIPGIELTENYENVSVDPQDFINQRVLILGKGNSAFETADNLISTAAMIHLASPCPIDLAWKTHYVGDLRAVNNNVLDTYQLKSQNAVLDADTVSIRRDENGSFRVRFAYLHAEGEVEELCYDRVICCTGFRFDDSIFHADCKPELTIYNKFPHLTCEWESVNQSGMYFIGTLMQMRDYKKSTSGFIHGFRYNVQAFSQLLADKYHDQPWPFEVLSLDEVLLTQKLLDRVNGSSALWQQQSFLGDVAVVQDEQTVHYYQAMPLAYLHRRFVDRDARCFVLTLEFGSSSDEDPFRVNRIRRDNVTKAASSTFLHPAIREYENGVKVAEHHIIEDLEAVWTEPEHIQPLQEFLARRIHSTDNRVAWE